MLSCAHAAAMPPAHAAAQPWASFIHPQPVKTEPTENMDESSFSKEQGSGFYSEGFHSASPSGSSKDSTGHSPRSVGSAGEPAPYFDSLSLHAKANLGLHLDAYRGGLPYMLTPPGFEPRSTDPRGPSPPYDGAYSPARAHLLPNNLSTPLPRADATPPKSPPRTPASADGDNNDRRAFHDSGFDGASQRKDSEDGNDGSGMDEDFEDEPGLRVPAVNSHGKVKTFKCKQCEFVAVTKLSFWEHSKEHIKPEKMLTCPKCPFVTEYKHHLEYHMRNHFGSKPFQCTQCSYSCVNKSMLNSHLKSHSNVYQYRCADCNYATKYCHSLKLHLRKYQHNPAMVLNMDGTPNPLPIIDVYGTRRGPKQKSMHSKSYDQPQNGMNNNQVPLPQPTHPLFRNQFPINLPYLPPLLQHSFLFPPNNNYEPKTSPKPEAEKQVSGSPPPSLLQQRLAYRERLSDARSVSPSKSPASLPRSPPPRASPPRASPPTQQPDDALDLTNAKTSEAGSPPPQRDSERPMPLTPTTSLKNRRKGRAYKLQPAALRLQHDEESRPASGTESDASADAPPPPSHYACQYCDISFGDLTMHTIHMGFHGYNDPFMCNKCGERSADRVAFFIHLGRAQHN
uniref:Protein hunchback n=1 Tax=Plutella xylostella TaxID=51655 RepID=A0A7D5PXY0_PLUXY|nr:hunchback-like protein [Plutella xylostella]